jgi:hypothetical protein
MVHYELHFRTKVLIIDVVYVRYCWLALIVVMVGAGCGQPLQINTPPPPRTTGTAGLPTLSPAIDAKPATANAGSAPTANQPIETVQAVPATPIVSAAPATAAPTSPATPEVVVIPQTAIPLNNEQRWRAQQIDRQAFGQQRLYIANNDVDLLWYDPITGQSLEIGTIRGEFPVQAQFILRNDRRPALEVPYRINQDFGLTAISEAVRARMKAAGYTASVEAYIEQSEVVVPK